LDLSTNQNVFSIFLVLSFFLLPGILTAAEPYYPLLWL